MLNLASTTSTRPKQSLVAAAVVVADVIAFLVVVVVTSVFVPDAVFVRMMMRM